MSRILIVYGTTDGHTRKVAHAVGTTLEALGCEVETHDAQRLSSDVRPDDFDAVMVAASLHAGGYQKAVRRWVNRHAVGLAGKPSAFLSVCLGILEKDPKVRHQLEEIIRQFTREENWHPGMVKMVAGALPYTRYTWFTRFIMKRIVAKSGGDTDTSRDYEYTDWEDLKAFTHEFVAQHGLAPSATALVAAAPVPLPATCPECARTTLPVTARE